MTKKVISSKERKELKKYYGYFYKGGDGTKQTVKYNEDNLISQDSINDQDLTDLEECDIL